MKELAWSHCWRYDCLPSIFFGKPYTLVIDRVTKHNIAVSAGHRVLPTWPIRRPSSRPFLAHAAARRALVLTPPCVPASCSLLAPSAKPPTACCATTHPPTN